MTRGFLFLSQSSGAANSWETPANSRSLRKGALVRRTRLSDLSKATSRQFVPVESMKDGVGNRHVHFPADSYKACPIEIPDTEIERSSIDRRARFFYCVSKSGILGSKGTSAPLRSDYLETDPLEGWGAKGPGGLSLLTPPGNTLFPQAATARGLGSMEINVAQWAKVTR